MKFNFSYEGGFAGLKYHLDADSDSLDPAHKKSLEAMAKLDNADLKKSNPQAKDMFRYKLNIAGNDKPTSLSFSDDNIPEGYEQLIAHLRHKAKL